MSDLPANVTAVRDRHGKKRYRFRRTGWPSAYVTGEPGSSEFHQSYAAILERGPHKTGPITSPRKVNPKTLDDLFARIKRSPKWRRKSPKTQHVQSLVIERFLDRVSSSGRRYGERPVSSVTVIWLETILGNMWETPAAANTLRKNLSGMMDYAIRLRWIVDNPVRLTEKYQEGEGFHDWTDDEINQFRNTHALGTMARLVLELTLNTAARRCNVRKIERDHIVDGRIIVEHAKGNNITSVPMMATTKAALDALPAAPIRYLVTTAYGKPFSEAGLGNRMRKWCDDAGLKHCTMHGLRKSMSRLLAESGSTDGEGMSVTGQRNNKTFAHYRAKANRTLLADHAFAKLGADLSNHANLENVQPRKKNGETSV